MESLLARVLISGLLPTEKTQSCIFSMSLFQNTLYNNSRNSFLILRLARFPTTLVSPHQLGPRLTFPVKCINRFEDDHIPDSQVWARQTVISDLSLLNAHINDGFDGIKAFLYLSWVTATIVPGMPWVLSHWDNKPHNIMVDEKDNFLAYISPLF